MNFHDTELRVIRWAEANGMLHENEERQALRVVSDVGSLCDSIAIGCSADISEEMGRVAINMIVLCAMLDIDLAKSLETAFNKISAKPVEVTEGIIIRGPFAPIEISGNVILDEPVDTGNVVLLKRE